MSFKEQELHLVETRIKRDAPTWKIDLSDPAHVFTVWADHPHRVQYCGSRMVLDEAWELAAEHVEPKDLYIAKGPLDVFGIMKFEPGAAGRTRLTTVSVPQATVSPAPPSSTTGAATIQRSQQASLRHTNPSVPWAPPV